MDRSHSETVTKARQAEDSRKGGRKRAESVLAALRARREKALADAPEGYKLEAATQLGYLSERILGKKARG